MAGTGEAALIRRERDSDAPAVGALVERAFGRAVLPVFVQRLRDDGVQVTALTFVAEVGGCVVGQVMFSRVTVQCDAGPWEALNLTPLSVDPAHQRRGIGAALVRSGLTAAADQSRFAVVVVEGDPSYYNRFGFVRASSMGLQRPSPAIPDAAFQAVALPPYAADRHHGQVRYPPLFEELGLLGPD